MKKKNEASHNTDHGNLAEPPKNVGYSPDESGVQGALHSDAKMPKGFKASKFVAENIAKFVSDFKGRNDISNVQKITSAVSVKEVAHKSNIVFHWAEGPTS